MPKRRKGIPRKAAETIRVESSDHLAGVGPRVASLLVVQGAEHDLGRQVLCNEPVVIGRDETATLTLSDGSASRHHCRVERDPESGRFNLVDLGSTNGTSVNGSKVSSIVPLAEGDKIFVGASALRFSYSDSLDLEYHDRIDQMVSTDPLTGMVSRHRYDPAYQAMVEQARHEVRPVSLLVLDLDGLKRINDTHGHDVGCYAIVESSNIIREILEPHGLISRFGGDEFVACLPGIERDHAARLAQEVCSRVADHNYTKDGVRVEPTISIGVATFPRDADTADALFSAADKALYDAKRAGRNQVAISRPD